MRSNYLLPQRHKENFLGLSGNQKNRKMIYGNYYKHENTMAQKDL